MSAPKLVWSEVKLPPINLYNVPKLWGYIINTKKKEKTDAKVS